MNTEKKLRTQLVKHLEGGEAFMPIDELVDKIPFEQLGVIPDKLPYSFWQQFYHMRMSQYDILEFSRNPDYSSKRWPEDYWPVDPAPASQEEWEDMVDTFYAERNQMADLVSDPGNSLFEPFAHGSGQTLLREALLVIEHTAYHTGQMLLILRLLGLHY